MDDKIETTSARSTSINSSKLRNSFAFKNILIS